jgi:stage II sporulation protein GA (sporulation sigma-E factor processing peptidase)
LQKVIYIDGIFLENLVMDLLLVRLTALTLKKTSAFTRILAGSLLGAGGYCLILCLPGISYPIKVIFGMVPVAMGMIRLGCRTRGIRELLYGTGCLFVYSFLLGGFILFLTNRLLLPGIRENSLLAVLAAGILGAEICMWGIKKYHGQRENHFCEVELWGDGEMVRVHGLVDTGNGLVDPISGKAAAILEEEVWNKIENAKKPEKYKIIPFHSIGKRNGILEGYEVERVRIRYGMTVKELTHVTIALSGGKLSAKGKYQMILPPEWLVDG